MTKESYALYTGLFLLVLGAASIGITLWLGHYGEEHDTYIVTTEGSVSGLVEESTVLYRGVNAGKVETIRFDPADVRFILVRINVKKGLPITHGTYAKLRIQGLTGLAQIELGDNGEDPQPLATSTDKPARITMRASLVDKLSDSGGNILIRAEELIARLNTLLNEEGQQRVQRILVNVETATAKLSGLEDRIDQAFAQVPALSGDARSTLRQARELALQLGQLTSRGQAILDDAGKVLVEGRSAGLKLNRTTLPRAGETLEELKAVAEELKKLSRRLNSDPQALLYGNLPAEPAPGEPGYRGGAR